MLFYISYPFVSHLFLERGLSKVRKENEREGASERDNQRGEEESN